MKVLITGGTGSLGRALVKRLDSPWIAVLSRDEFKQGEMREQYPHVRYFLGDVRDRERLMRAFHGVDVVIHAAALKQVPGAEYNPTEFVKTNILGAQNVIEAALDRGVKKVIALSTDKASSPINLYGGTKFVSDKLFVAANAYGGNRTAFSVVRYGNVMGSRGSLVWKLRSRPERAEITDERMTRFWTTLPDAAQFVLDCLGRALGGEIFVNRLRSVRILDIISAVAKDVQRTGIRPGEKLHEEMISVHESRRAIDRGDHFVILPDVDIGKQYPAGRSLPGDFRYASDTNSEWVEAQEIPALLESCWAQIDDPSDGCRISTELDSWASGYRATA